MGLWPAKKRQYNPPNNIGIMEKKMETTTAYWAYIEVREKKMETTGVLGTILGHANKAPVRPSSGRFGRCQVAGTNVM